MFDDVHAAILVFSGRHEYQLEMKKLLKLEAEIVARSSECCKIINSTIKSKASLENQLVVINEQRQITTQLEKEMLLLKRDVRCLLLASDFLGYPNMYDGVFREFNNQKYTQDDF